MLLYDFFSGRHLIVTFASVSHETKKKLYAIKICLNVVPELHLFFWKFNWMAVIWNEKNIKNVILFLRYIYFHEKLFFPISVLSYLMGVGYTNIISGR